MTCKGCESRKGKIRRWLGITDILYGMGRNLTRYVDRRVLSVTEAGAELEKRIEALEAEVESLRLR